MGRKLLSAVAASGFVVLGLQAVTTPANAAGPPNPLIVGTSHASCPTARFHTIQSAVDAAHPGDTVNICPGTYVEGSGQVGRANALTITKSLTLAGAGADQVTIKPRKKEQRRADRRRTKNPDIRDGNGDRVIAVTGHERLAGHRAHLRRHRRRRTACMPPLGWCSSTPRDRSITPMSPASTPTRARTGTQVPGGFRSNPFGYGIALVSTASNPRGGGGRGPHNVDHTRVNHYNALGMLVGGRKAAGHADQRPDHQPQPVPELQQPHGQQARPSSTATARRRVASADPAAVAADDWAAVRPGWGPGDRRRRGADDR